MVRKIILAIFLLLLSGCSATIYDSSKEKTYNYSLTFDDDDLDDSYSDEKHIVLEQDEDLYIEEGGTYLLSGQLNAGIVVDTNEEVKLVLNNITITNDDFAAIYVKSAKKCTITLNEGSTNYISDGENYTQIDENSVDAAIFSKADLVLNGTGTLTVNGNYRHGIVSKDDLIIIDGTYNIVSNSQGICGKDCVKIHDGTINIESGKDSIKSNNDEDEGRGYVYIAGGNININSGDDGIQAYNDLIIDGGTINISKSYEGLEASYIKINGGNINIASSDDGINASNKSGGNTASITISDGKIYINAQGDGIDSNGQVFITGGTLFVEGPLSGGDSAFDYETGGYVSGGEVIMIGQSDMAEGFSEDGTSQCNLLYNFDSSFPKDSVITISNNGKTIFEETTTKMFNSLLISSEKISIGDTITITINDETYKYTLESTTNTYGNNRDGMPNGNFDPNNNEMQRDDNEDRPDMFNRDDKNPPNDMPDTNNDDKEETNK